MAFSNPFSRDVEGQRRNINAYKVLTLLTWALQFAATIYLSISGKHRAFFGHHSGFVPSSPFTLNSVFVEIYWAFLYIFQIIYVWHLFSSEQTRVDSAASVGSHFVTYNILHFVWLLFWTHSLWILAEIVLIINFLNLTSLYLRHATAPRLIHLATTVLPLTFTFFMLYWNGSVMIHMHNIVTRIVANVFIWGQLVYAGFFLLAFKDYYVGFATSYLAFALAVGQLGTKAIALQWPFAFAIAGITFILSAIVGFPEIFGTTEGRTRSGERAPLLQEGA